MGTLIFSEMAVCFCLFVALNTELHTYLASILSLGYIPNRKYFLEKNDIHVLISYLEIKDEVYL